MLTLHGLIERQAADRPQALALTFKDLEFSYADLQERIDRCASALHARGVKSGDAFGILTRNGPEFIIMFFALMRLGARAVPVNFLLKADEIAYIFRDAGAVGVLTQPAFLKNVRQAAKGLSKLRDVVVAGGRGEEALSFEALLESAGPAAGVPRSADAEAVAMVIYTSGTTGKPKGAMLTHRNFVANAEQCIAMVPTLSPRDIFLCLLPMFHSFAWTVCVVLPLRLGGRIVVIESIQPFGEVIKQIMRRRATIFVAVPPIYSALLRVPFWRPMRWINPVRLSISGAAALPGPVQQKFEKKFGVPLLEGYGLTEASPVVTLNPEKNRRLGSVGQALPGIRLRIVDEGGQELPAGEVGEICVQGDNVMKGYYRQEEATREAFLDEDWRWLRTGDVGRLDADGYLFISDRKKDLIIVKGLNVYPKEVEDVLFEHPAVQEAAVIGLPDETGDEIIRAYVTLKAGVSVDKQELMKLCRSKLAPYKCPKDLEIRPELPKNTLGKILKRQLRAEAKAERRPL